MLQTTKWTVEKRRTDLSTPRLYFNLSFQGEAIFFSVEYLGT